jgi:hypothetical protein
VNVRRLPRFRNHVMTVTLDIDVTPFLRNLQRAAEQMAKSVDTMAQAVRGMGKALARAREVSVSGLEARMYVRAGLDPAYASEEALDGLVRLLLRKPSAVLGLGDSMMLGTRDRARLAAAAMRGWAEHRPAPWRHPEVEYHEATPWFRYMAGQRVYLYADRLQVVAS